MLLRAIRSGQPDERAHPRPHAALPIITIRGVEGRRVCVGGCAQEENVTNIAGHCSISWCLVVALGAPFGGDLWMTSKAFNSVVRTGCPIAPGVLVWIVRS